MRRKEKGRAEALPFPSSGVTLDLLSGVGSLGARVAAQRRFEGARGAGVAHLGGDARTGSFDRDQQVAAQEGAEALVDHRVRQNQVAVDRQGEGAGGASGVAEGGRLTVEVEHTVRDRDANHSIRGAGVRQAHLRLRLRLRTREPRSDEVRAVQRDHAGSRSTDGRTGVTGGVGRRQGRGVGARRDRQLVSSRRGLRQQEVRCAKYEGVHLSGVQSERRGGSRLRCRATGRDGSRQVRREGARDHQRAGVDHVSSGNYAAAQAGAEAANCARSGGGNGEVAAQLSGATGDRAGVGDRSCVGRDAFVGKLFEVRQSGLDVVRGRGQRGGQDVLIANQGASSRGVDRRGHAAGGDSRRRGNSDIGFSGRVADRGGQGEAVDDRRAGAGRSIDGHDVGDRRSGASALDDRSGSIRNASDGRLIDSQDSSVSRRDRTARDVERDLEGLRRCADGDRRLGRKDIGDDQRAGVGSVGAFLGNRVSVAGIGDGLAVDGAGDGAGLGGAGEEDCHGRGGGQKSGLVHLNEVPEENCDVDVAND